MAFQVVPVMDAPPPKGFEGEGMADNLARPLTELWICPHGKVPHACISCAPALLATSEARVMTSCHPGAHVGPFKFGAVAGWMTCVCGTDLMTRNLENNREAISL